VDRDEVALGDHPVQVRVNGTDLGEPCFRGFQAIGRLRVVVAEAALTAITGAGLDAVNVGELAGRWG